MSKFDQVESQPYGKCNDCGVELSDKAAASEHMSQTLEEVRAHGGNGSHRIRVVNDTREGRIENGVSRIVDDAITEAIEELWGLVDSGDATEKEVAAGLAFHSEFQDAWQESVDES